jgi:hypothetical protein
VNRVVSLTQRRRMDPAAVIPLMPPDARPLPLISAQDELLAKRTDELTGTASRRTSKDSNRTGHHHQTGMLRRCGLTEQASHPQEAPATTKLPIVPFLPLRALAGVPPPCFSAQSVLTCP